MSTLFDLTGTDPDFLKTGIRSAVFMTDQIIPFDTPVFSSSLVVFNETGSTTLALNTDYVIYEEDTQAKSKALLLNSGFSATLVKSIKITKTFSTIYYISCTYQSLFQETSILNSTLVQPADVIEITEASLSTIGGVARSYAINGLYPVIVYATDTGVTAYLTPKLDELNARSIVTIAPTITNTWNLYPINYPTALANPALISKEELADILADIEYLKSGDNLASSTLSDSVNDIHMMEIDLTATEEDNFVEAEVHTINVPAKKQIIAPNAGSFYKTGLVVKVVSTSTTLTEGTDYIVCGTNFAKTKLAEDTSGVYEFIYIITSFVGDVAVTYHAFGGALSQADVDTIHDALVSAK
jgi:hypothetical protein